MSYRLKFDERVDKLWRRIVHEQIDTALALLAEGKNVPVAVHETRKSMKRVRDNLLNSLDRYERAQTQLFDILLDSSPTK